MDVSIIFKGESTMKRVFLILLLLLLICACAQAEQTRYPSSGENLPQLHALIVSGASKVKTIYMPIAGCEALYEALPANKIHVDVQPSNLFFRSYDSEESIGGLPSCTREEFEGWIDEAFGQSEEGDLNIFYYCIHIFSSCINLYFPIIVQFPCSYNFAVCQLNHKTKEMQES